MSLTPSGKKRNPSSFSPFSGGMRVCLGKTLADANLKIMVSYMTQIFNFEHEEKRFQEREFPTAHFLQSEGKPIWVKLSLNKGD